MGEKLNNEKEFWGATKGDELEPRNVGINEEEAETWSGWEQLAQRLEEDKDTMASVSANVGEDADKGGVVNKPKELEQLITRRGQE